jgi:hypothetical protein
MNEAIPFEFSNFQIFKLHQQSITLPTGRDIQTLKRFTMELILLRTYTSEGTNGTLYADNEKICHTIELPYLNNIPHYSCIPEGVYQVGQRISRKFGKHLLVKHIPGRHLILFHPANNAMKELKGCIAPVTKLTGNATGIYSKRAMRALMEKVKHALKNETVFLIIKKQSS